MNWVRESDVVVAEVSTPSLGVGYEIGQAESMGKKILCIYRNGSPKNLSAMIEGNNRVKVLKYEELEGLKSALQVELGKDV